MNVDLPRRVIAEFFGTFWLVLGAAVQRSWLPDSPTSASALSGLRSPLA